MALLSLSDLAEDFLGEQPQPRLGRQLFSMAIAGPKQLQPLTPARWRHGSPMEVGILALCVGPVRICWLMDVS